MATAKVLIPEGKDITQFTDQDQPNPANRTLHRWQIKTLERTAKVNIFLQNGGLVIANAEQIASFEEKYAGRENSHEFKYKEVEDYQSNPKANAPAATVPETPETPEIPENDTTEKTVKTGGK